MANVRELAEDERAEIMGFAEQAAAMLAVSMVAPPSEIVTKVNDLLSAIEDGEVPAPEDDLVMGMGLLVGIQYTRAFDWSWGYVTWEGGYEAHSVVSPDKSIAITPIQWVNGICKKERTTNVLLNFNMVAAGKHPSAEPGTCTLFQ